MAKKFIVPAEYHDKTKVFLRQIVRTMPIEEQDQSALFLLGDCFNTYILARELLLKDGFLLEPNADPVLPGMELTGINKVRNIRPHPALRIATDSHNQLIKLLIEFNLTPKSRKKPEPVPLEDEAPIEEKSPMERFILKKTGTDD